jgi:AcrR family transcriptional regulator
MNAQPKAKPDDTRARIIETADALFRRLGFAKTAVADIAGELRMSPANIYRFFPSKDAIVEAICKRCLAELDEQAFAVARGRGSAAARFEQLFLKILAYHRENLLTDQRVNDIVLVAIEQNWGAIQAHKEVIRHAVEMIVRDGVAAGEFAPVDAREVSALLLRSLVGFCNPVCLAETMKDGEDVEAQLRATTRFLLGAITPR